MRKAAGGLSFYNTSKLTFRKLLGDADHVADNLRRYIARSSPSAREIIDKFKFGDNITRLDEAGLLYLVLAEFAKPELDLHPRRVSPVQMGHIFEELGTEAWRAGRRRHNRPLSWASGRDIRESWASQSRARR